MNATAGLPANAVLPRRLLLAGVVAGLIGVTGCAVPGSATGGQSTGSPSASPSPSAAAEGEMVDVGGHSLYLRCEGTGTPTVVYVHGWVEDAAYVPHRAAGEIAGSLSEDHRVCLYDRRNTGSSEAVDAEQTPDDMRHDMEAVLTNGAVEPPYILMAASFGGLVAYDFLNHHPDQVSGMVLLDAMIPDELALDKHLSADDTFLHYRDDDLCCMPERTSQYDLISGLQQYIGQEPAIPMIYLAAAEEPRVEYSWVTPEYAARYPDVLQGFVDRFAPGELRWVDAPHVMEPVIPQEIADAVREVANIAATK